VIRKRAIVFSQPIISSTLLSSFLAKVKASGVFSTLSVLAFTFTTISSSLKLASPQVVGKYETIRVVCHVHQAVVKGSKLDLLGGEGEAYQQETVEEKELVGFTLFLFG
jgi:hypothetical protein